MTALRNDRLPRRALSQLGFGFVISHLSLLLLPLLLLWRPLFNGESLFWGTPLLQFVPWQRMAAEMWRAGQLPLWNPLLGCGAPLAANYQTGAFYPLYGLALFLPAEVALGWAVALHLVLTGLGMYAWARSAGLERFPALVAGVALEGSGFLVARAGLFPSIVVAFAWLPIWLWRAERLAQTRGLHEALWLGGALGLGFLAGHAQTAFYGTVLLVAYLTFRLVREARDSERRSRFGLCRLSSVILPFVVGLGLAAVQLLPTAELFRLSQRATGVGREVGLTYSLWPWRLLTLAAPGLFGNPARGDYWGYANYWEDALYIGLLPLLLALGAVGRLRHGGRWRDMVSFWLLVAGGSLLLALGGNTPIFPWLFDHAPTFNWFQAPARWLALTTVALAALAGIGAQEWRWRRADRRRGGLGVSLGLAVVLGGLAAPRLMPGVRSTFGPATVRLGLALTMTGGLALLRRRGGGDHPWWRMAAVGFLLLDLLTFGWGLVPSVDRALYGGRSHTGVLLADDPSLARVFWPAAGRPEAGYDLKFGRFFRFDTFGPRGLDFWWPLREALLPNVGMLDGVASANNFDPLLVGAYADVAQAADTCPGLLRAMGVTHLVTATLNADVYVTALSAPLGRAWLAHSARLLPPAQVLQTLADPSFDPAAEVLLTTPAHPPTQTTNHPNNQLPPPTLHDTANRVTIRAVLDRPGYLVLADTWYPGWEAVADGEPVPILRANHAFRAIYLGAGEHTVEMVYRPLSVRVGVVVSLATLVGLVGGLVFTCGRRKRG